MVLDNITLQSIIDALFLLSSSFFIIGILIGSFCSRYLRDFLLDLDRRFKRPARIKLADGSYLYRFKDHYVTMEFLKNHVRRIREKT